VNRRARILADWVVPLAALAALTVLFRFTTIDVDVERRFYDGGFTRAHEQPWEALYRYGVVPAWVVSVGALALLVASRWNDALASHRRAFLYLALVMAVGPGLLVNTAFKEHWGRPRPVDLPEFGGSYAFVTVWDKGDPDRGESFPSGHAATGFYFFALYFALRGRSRRAWTWVAIALTYGSLVGLARMIQGKHFLSDVVWAAGFVYLASAALCYVVKPGASAPAGTGR
jgi:membrane-associated PAP2 superfamily phosphatase